MDALFSLGHGGAREVVTALREPEALDSVRVTLKVLEEKGYVTHQREGRRNVYVPRQSMAEAQRSAWQQLTHTFFRGSPSRALLALMDLSADRLTDRDLDEIAQWAQQSARKGRKR